jgi:polyphenol oxidase
MSVLGSRILEETGIVRFAVSTRSGGVSPVPFGMNLSFRVGDDPANVERNRRLFLAQIGATPEQLAIPVQIHSATVRRADAPGEYPDCDALVSGVENVVLAVSVADCVPVFLVDPVGRAVGAVHAGWRGTAAGIVTEAVAAMGREFGSRPADLVAHIGPSAGVCCYVVGQDVAGRFTPEVIVHRSDGPYVDLKSANLRQLLAAGLLPERVDVSPLCTITESTLLHSFRRDKERSGRMMGAICLADPSFH